MNRRTIRLGSATPLALLLLGGALWPSPAVAQTVFTVTKLADTNDGACNADCSLREAIAAAASGDTVTFAPGVTGTLTLSLGRIDISIGKNLTIQGPGASQLSIEGGTSASFFVIYNYRASLTISDITFSRNSGGAIVNQQATLIVTNSTFTGNSNMHGGAIRNSYGNLVITNSTFSGNSARAGGAILNDSGTLIVINSTFSGNSATGFPGSGTNGGGAIYNNGGPLVVTNSTFHGNSATWLGVRPICCPGWDGSGGAINSLYSSLSLGNTIIAGNTATFDGPDVYGGITSRGHNLVGKRDGASGLTNGVKGDQVGSNANPINPLLGPLANNGGPTATHALLPGSPAIDAGDNTMCAAAIGSPTYGAGGLDQRGMARPQGAGCDIGAFELPPSDVTPPEITPTVTGTSGNNGWYTSNVSVSWSVTDPNSAISTSSGCGSSTVISDTAGTTFTCSATSAGGTASNNVIVKRDATAPTITGSRSPDANANGWNNTDVTVSFVCSDNLSGVATCASAITLSADGANQSVTGNTATDFAGNTASATVTNIHIDKTAPTITASRTPANGAGWNNGDVTVTFTCSDPLSGLAGPCPSPQIVTAEGAGQSLTGTVADLAGNSASLIVADINIDRTAPTITGSRTPAANASGWNNTDVTVSFICADGLSAIESCGPTPQVVSTEGSAQSRTATAVDKAGNEASATVGGINIDKTPPVVIPPANVTAQATSFAGAVVTYENPTATDAVGVVTGPACTPASGSTFPLGTTTVTCSASDAASNTGTAIFTVTVEDTTKPVVIAPANVTAQATSPAGAVVNYENPTGTDAVGVVTGPACTPASGSTFPLGTTTVTCSASDAASNTGTAIFTVTVADTTAPSVVIITPTLDSPIASSPVTVQVQAADAVGVTAVAINGVAASLISGTPPAGTWQASVPVSLPVPPGGAFTVTVTASDAAGNPTSGNRVFDNDGIATSIDTQPATNSNDFSDIPLGGTTSGTIAVRGGWTVGVSDVSPGGMQATVSGAGTLAKISICLAGGAEQVELDGNGEAATIECVTTTGLNTGSTVTAVSATAPAANPKIIVRNSSGQIRARLSTGQSMTVGSPVTAGSTNAGTILVELVDANDLPFGSFELDAAESVDVTFTTGVNDVAVVELHVLVGPVDFTIGTRTVTLDTGDAGTFPTDVTPPTIADGAVTPTVLWPANHKMVDVAVRYEATDDRDPAPTCRLNVASNEPLNGTGDGDASPDWVVVDARRLQLRAERSGTGTGRVYTLTVTCGDASGNLATRQLAVTVPKNQR